ncbi:MAG: polyamine aminopropyltransferase [Deferrisomatales bacterium]
MAGLDLWFQETHKDQIAFSVRVTGYLWSGKSEFQTLDVIDTEAFGRVLLLDGLFMTTEKDEFIYHEMIAHVPLFSHPAPRRVLVIGGGDGGTVREAVRHPTVEQVDLVEIDRLVVEKSREFLPTIACALDDPKVRVHYEDGIRWVQGHADTYDVIVVDSTDPIGPAVGLFSEAFYADCRKALTADGVLTAQTESPFFDREEVTFIYGNLRKVFPDARPYTASIPTYPGGYWCFAFASKGPDPLDGPDPERYRPLGEELKYYNPEIHRAAFALPTYFRKLLGP